MKSATQRLIKCLEEVLDLLEHRGTDVEGTVFVSTQQPFGELAHFLWDLRRGGSKNLWQLALLFGENGQFSRLADNNGWSDKYASLKDRFDESFSELNCVRYHGSGEAVQLGDHVRLRVLFRKTVGRVSYVAGQSKANPEIDFGGLFRIGVDVPDGPFVAVHVEPDSLVVKRGVALLRRDSDSIPDLPTDEELRS